jgi:acyl-CoA synthetase (AMP-forming)/AMP-acid ligase II
LAEHEGADVTRLDLNRVGEFLERVVDSNANPGECRASAVEAIRSRWRQIGLDPGSLVILALPSTADALDHFFGAFLASLVPTLVSPATPTLRLCEMAKALGARAIVTRRLDVSQVATRRIEPLETATVFIVKTESPSLTRAGEIVLQTSGTSGMASACVFDLETSLLNASLHLRSIDQRPEDVVLVSLPLHFSFALVAQALAALNCGGSIAIGTQPFHVSSFIDTIRRHGVTMTSLTPIQARLLLAQSEAWPADLRVLTVGGDTALPHEVEALLRLKGSRELYLTYGLTQAGPRVSTLVAHAASAAQLASVGRPLPGVTVSLRPTNSDQRLGELLVASPTAMKRRIGQIDNPDPGNAQVIATGDIFRMDDEGYLYFEERLSDFIVINGNKIHLASIRRVASACPGVLAVKTKAVGAPYPHSKQQTGYDLFLTVSGDSELARASVQSRFRRWLRPSELPRHIHISQALDDTAYKQ